MLPATVKEHVQKQESKKSKYHINELSVASAAIFAGTPIRVKHTSEAWQYHASVLHHPWRGHQITQERKSRKWTDASANLSSPFSQIVNTRSTVSQGWAKWQGGDSANVESFVWIWTARQLSDVVHTQGRYKALGQDALAHDLLIYKSTVIWFSDATTTVDETTLYPTDNVTNQCWW